MSDGGSFEMPHVSLDPAGPERAALDLLEAIVVERDLQAAWPLIDRNLRLSLAQLFIWENRDRIDREPAEHSAGTDVQGSRDRAGGAPVRRTSARRRLAGPPAVAVAPLWEHSMRSLDHRADSLPRLGQCIRRVLGRGTDIPRRRRMGARCHVPDVASWRCLAARWPSRKPAYTWMATSHSRSHRPKMRTVPPQPATSLLTPIA